MSEAVAQPRPLRHPWLAPRIALPVLALLLLVQLPFLHWAFRGAAEITTAVPFEDKFDRASLGDNYFSNGGHWRIVDGQLYSPGVGNNPLWLKARLPADAAIEFDVRSEGSNGDVKCEAWGDGRTHSTGYLFLFGAWANRESRIAKLDEHALTLEEIRAQLAALARPYPRQFEGAELVWETLRGPFVRYAARRDLEKLEKGSFFGTETPFVVKRMDLKVEKSRTYHFKITKRGREISWEIDGAEQMHMTDPAPLSGSGHDRFGFTSWQNDTYFDNLKISPL